MMRLARVYAWPQASRRSAATAACWSFAGNTFVLMGSTDLSCSKEVLRFDFGNGNVSLPVPTVKSTFHAARADWFDAREKFTCGCRCFTPRTRATFVNPSTRLLEQWAHRGIDRPHQILGADQPRR